jgi:hypothetical protein
MKRIILDKQMDTIANSLNIKIDKVNKPNKIKDNNKIILFDDMVDSSISFFTQNNVKEVYSPAYYSKESIQEYNNDNINILLNSENNKICSNSNIILLSDNVESSNVESSNIESSNVESSNVESSNIESSNVESSNIESSNVENNNEILINSNVISNIENRLLSNNNHNEISKNSNINKTELSNMFESIDEIKTKKKESTDKITLNLLLSGLNIKDISDQRKIKEQTIVEHILKNISHPNITWKIFMNEFEYNQIKKAFELMGIDVLLRQIKNYISKDISYDKISIVKEGVIEASKNVELYKNTNNKVDSIKEYLKLNGFEIIDETINDVVEAEVNIHFKKI